MEMGNLWARSSQGAFMLSRNACRSAKRIVTWHPAANRSAICDQRGGDYGLVFLALIA